MEKTFATVGQGQFGNIVVEQPAGEIPDATILTARRVLDPETGEDSIQITVTIEGAGKHAYGFVRLTPQQWRQVEERVEQPWRGQR